MDDTRRALLRWTTSVMEARGWSAAHWSRLAQVTPSSLTRFLSDPARGSLPSAETIGRLARAAGSEPRFIDGMEPAPVVRVPLLDHDQVVALLALGRRAAEAFLAAALRQNGGCVAVEPSASPRAFALTIASRSLDAAGVLPEDKVVLEPPDVLEPRVGDVVVTVGGGAFCAYRFFPPHLLPVSTDPGCGPASIADARVAGVAVHVLRVLRL
ncbi:helix-turn-helix transcriptional regulator [Azospirillum sp. RWY-5-1]|uniref:Helix-turn-helix transcriptional regulator n=1 Tax=Azospirillum oleiclasticum TaxID=2735135 RepID=A0ABX2T1D2_9PROT|nr:helix-turn-helix transcriptional regulator [Azospirillum oleiclasticum]NYZ10958.1 helix-turn-helix transcriptional regulator [Azospirillum oleiclasticum]NYZ18120.1 helix-turn-helix transcriptional regulator [Azospirillum oleiclasticum]